MSIELMSQIFSDFGKNIGITIDVDSDGYCCLGIDDKSLIHFKFNEHFNGLIYFTELGDMPNFGKKEIFRHYAIKNGQESSSTYTFSFDHETNQLGMAYLLPQAMMNIENFEDTLKEFIEYANKEMEQLARFVQGEKPEDNIQYETEDLNDSAGANDMLPSSFDMSKFGA